MVALEYDLENGQGEVDRISDSGDLRLRGS
jgi:hypothetical protein